MCVFPRNDFEVAAFECSLHCGENGVITNATQCKLSFWVQVPIAVAWLRLWFLQLVIPRDSFTAGAGVRIQLVFAEWVGSGLLLLLLVLLSFFFFLLQHVWFGKWVNTDFCFLVVISLCCYLRKKCCVLCSGDGKTPDWCPWQASMVEAFGFLR